MFVVKPLLYKEIQSELCNSLNTPFIPHSNAYFAADVSEDGSSINGIIGILQYTVDGEDGEILSLIPAPGKEDDEAMIIMERACMSFMWRNGVKRMTMREIAGPEAVLKKSGLPIKDGTYYVDLDVFFSSPCHFNKN